MFHRALHFRPLLAFGLLFITHEVQSSNILWISGLASPSHQLWSGVLQRELVGRGHNVTAISVDVPQTTQVTQNLTFIHMENVYKYYSSSGSNSGYSSLFDATGLKTILLLNRFRAYGCVPALKSAGLARLMDYPRDFRFDLVVHDFVGTHCLLGLVKRFGDPPVMGASAGICPIAIAHATGNPQYPATIPANQLTQSYDMDWPHRLYNFVLYAFDNAYRWWAMYPMENEMAREFFGDPSLDVAEISRRSALTLINLPPYDVMLPLHQTVIPVGGLHIEKPRKLENNLKKFMDEAQDGVIYFALGTNLNSDMFSLARAKYFLEAFERLPTYRVVWKFNESLLNAPLHENVLMQRWLPQNDILAHPKVKAFIGHGGALGCQEAVWHAVPQLIVPAMIDQRQNAARAVARGLALKLDYSQLSADAVEASLRRLVTEESFARSARAFSAIFRDQPQAPLARAAFWVEFVLRHGEAAAARLRSPAQDSSYGESWAVGFSCYLMPIFVGLLVVCLSGGAILRAWPSSKGK